MAPIQGRAIGWRVRIRNAREKEGMPITLKLTEDEAEIIVDALEADAEGYQDSILDARANGKRSEIETFSEAVERINAVRDKVRKAIGG